jgi:hypothetical protein
VFIGCSSAAQPSLRKVANWLEEAGARPVPWTKLGLFRPGTFLLTKLIEYAETLDAAVFIFAEDDRVKVGERYTSQTRDNVLIEFGLFCSVMGHSKAIACRHGSPKIPSDMGGLTYVDISPAKARLAQLQIGDWIRDLSANADSGKFFRSRVDVTDLDAGYDTLRERHADRRSKGRVNGAASPTQAGDPVTNAVSKGIMVRLLQPSAFPNLVKHSTYLDIDKKGNCRCKVVQKVRGDRRILRFSPHFMSGDVELESIDDLALRITSRTENRFLWWMPIEDRPHRKSILIRYDPPVKDNEERDLEIDWQWPGIFARLADREADYWDEKTESASPISVFRVNLKLDHSLPRIQIKTEGQMGGKNAQVEELPVDKNGNRRYAWQASGIHGRSQIALKLVPLYSRSR